MHCRGAIPVTDAAEHHIKIAEHRCGRGFDALQSRAFRGLTDHGCLDPVEDPFDPGNDGDQFGDDATS